MKCSQFPGAKSNEVHIISLTETHKTSSPKLGNFHPKIYTEYLHFVRPSISPNQELSTCHMWTQTFLFHFESMHLCDANLSITKLKVSGANLLTFFSSSLSSHLHSSLVITISHYMKIIKYSIFILTSPCFACHWHQLNKQIPKIWMPSITNTCFI